MNDNWDFLISEFRRLGGIADNVCQKEGKYGRGIFPVNPNLKAKIFTPYNLLINKDDIYLEDNKLRIKKDRNYDKEVRNFFNLYQDNFSWGSGGKETTELFEKGLSLFSASLKDLLKKYNLVDIDLRHKGEWNSSIKTQFLNARGVKFRSISVIAPIWELVNHGVRKFPFIVKKDGISTSNYISSNYEIRHSYNNLSPSRRFFSYGFFSEESIVFSMPFTVNLKKLGIYISCKGNNLQDDSIRIARSKKQIILDGLPIADANHPRMPYAYFDEIIRKIEDINLPQEFLSNIFQLNISMRKEVIYECLLLGSDASKTLSRVMQYEINLISSHN